MFSAKKYRGVPLYKYARKGVEVPRDLKEVEIYEIKLKKVELPFVEFFLRCSKGTYVRTLAHDIGEALGCGGHLYSLTRLRNGPFSLEDAKDLQEVLRLAEEGRLSEVVWDLNKALGYLNSLELEGKNLYRILHGGFVFLEDKELKEGLVRLVDGEGKLVAIGLVNRVGKEWMVKPLKVLGGRA
jgi:tRNA pseudouridine55 synthase